MSLFNKKKEKVVEEIKKIGRDYEITQVFGLGGFEVKLGIQNDKTPSTVAEIYAAAFPEIDLSNCVVRVDNMKVELDYKPNSLTKIIEVYTKEEDEKIEQEALKLIEEERIAAAIQRRKDWLNK